MPKHRRRNRTKMLPPPTPVPAHQLSAIARRAGTAAVEAEWPDPDDVTPSARRTGKTINGYRRVDQLAAIVERSRHLERIHLEAAERARRCFEQASGAQPGHGRGLYDGAPVIDLTNARDPSQHQLAATRHWKRVADTLGAVMTSIFTAVAIDNQTVTEWTEARGLNLQLGMGILIAALERLVEFYGLSLSRRGAQRLWRLSLSAFSPSPKAGQLCAIGITRQRRGGVKIVTSVQNAAIILRKSAA